MRLEKVIVPVAPLAMNAQTWGQSPPPPVLLAIYPQGEQSPVPFVGLEHTL